MMGLCLRLAHEEPHSPIDNPALTVRAKEREGRIRDVLARNTPLSQTERMAEAEAALLSKWSYASDWRSYLDSPLIAHADAMLSLKNMYDGVVGIESAGTPYAEIFKIMGHDVFSVDYSHHRRRMDAPVIDSASLEKLRTKKNVLLTDVDIVTGKTIKDVSTYLQNRGVPITGVYLGLSEWPGLDCDEPAVNEDTVNFDTFWKRCGNTRQLKNGSLYTMNILPRGLRVFTSNGSIEECHKESHPSGLSAARRVASYLVYHETENY